MLDFRYLTVNDLEKLKANLENENKRLTTVHPSTTVSFFNLNQAKENEKIIEAIEHEIFERTILGAKTDGGVSN